MLFQQMEEECVERDDSVGTSGYNSDSAGTSEPGGAGGSGSQPARREERGGREQWLHDHDIERRPSKRLSRHAGWKKTEDSRLASLK